MRAIAPASATAFVFGLEWIAQLRRQIYEALALPFLADTIL
jgi:hypothetical protein